MVRRPAGPAGCLVSDPPGTGHGPYRPQRCRQIHPDQLHQRGGQRPEAGCILLGQRPVEALPAHEIAALGVARTFQNLKLFGRLTVLDNVLTGLTVAAERSFVVSMLRLPALRHQERQLRLWPWSPGRFRAGTESALAGIGAVLRRKETGGDGPRLRGAPVWYFWTNRWPG
jgi:hypothetical protein